MPAAHFRRLLLDFGMVLTLEQDRTVFSPLLARLDINPPAFFLAWTRHRPAYDLGLLSAPAYWQLVLADCLPTDADRTLGALAQMESATLTDCDFEAFCRPRPLIHQVARDSLISDRAVGILSNMPAGMGERWLQVWPWLRGCQICLWSGQEALAKPDPAIYRLFLKRSGWLAADTLFVDDVAANLEPAAALGMATHHFSNEAAANLVIRDWLDI